MGMFSFLIWLSHRPIFNIGLWAQPIMPLCLPWSQGQLFPEAWAGSMGWCSVYLSFMYMGNKLKHRPLLIMGL